MKKLIILGSGSFAEEVADLVDDTGEHELAGFGESLDRSRLPGPLLGVPIHWVADLETLASDHEAVCAITSPKRSTFIDTVEKMGFRFARVRHPSGHSSLTSHIGAGTIIGVSVVVAAHTQIGRHVIVNRGALIGHHTRIGDLVTISPGVNIGDQVEIEDGASIGMGATLLSGIKIGRGAIVEAGSTVTEHVPDHVEVQGSPAQIQTHDTDA